MEDMLHNAIGFVQGIDVSEPHCGVDMQSLIESLAEDFRETGHDMAVHGTVTCLLPGYARNLRRCPPNLLENATCFAQHVVIDVDDTASVLRITVSDDGPGVANTKGLAAMNGDRPYNAALDNADTVFRAKNEGFLLVLRYVPSLPHDMPLRGQKKSADLGER
jgi:hypothetical protein